MKIKELLFASLALFIISASCGSAYCQDDSVVSGMTIDGSVVSVDLPKSQIVVKSSDLMTFFLPPDAKIINDDGFDMQLSSVHAGDYVTVDYHDDQSGSHIMEFMEVEYNR